MTETYGVIKLLTPPFDKSSLNPGYIKNYLPGTRENGGQYTHAAIWTIIAFTLMNQADKAYELYKMINPIEHSDTKNKVETYKVEPYVIAADVYTSANLAGQGGWTWYTGSSSWYYVCGIEYILGIKVRQGVLSVEPSVSSMLGEYSVRYRYGSSLYEIAVRQASRTGGEAGMVCVDGKVIAEGRVSLADDGGAHSVEVWV